MSARKPQKNDKKKLANVDRNFGTERKIKRERNGQKRIEVKKG